MKKLLLLTSLIFLGFSSSYATHLMGAEITYTYVGGVSGNDYEITLAVYRDCNGVNLSTFSQNVDFESVSCTQNFNFSLPYVQTVDVSQVCGTATTTCNGGTVPGTEQFIYRAIVTLTPCADWIIHWDSGNRNPAITNLVNPNGSNLYVQNTLNNIIGANNNSPQYFNLPTPYLCANNLAIFTHGASDADGDSLYYSLNNPFTTPGPPGTPIAFMAGYSLLQPMITSGGMNLDQQTGEMCFTPSQSQISVVSVLIEEFRSGTLIGSQIREMQVVVTGCINQNPTTGVAATCGGAAALNITTQGPSVFQTDPNSLIMCPNDNVCFDVLFSDPDGDNITITSNIAVAIPAATFIVTNNNTPNPFGTFCWTPTALDSGLNIVAITATDDACPISGTQSFVFDITVFDEPYAGEDDTICESESIQLTASGGATYTWYEVIVPTPATPIPVAVGANFSCNPCFNPIASPLVTTNYYVESSLTAACENTDSVIITVIPGYTISSTQSNINICNGDTVDFSTVPSIPGGYVYGWTSNTGILTTPNDSTTTGTFNTTGPDTVIVTVSNTSCSLTDTLFVNVAALPNINITIPDTLLDCTASLPINVNLGAAPSPNNFSYSWSFPTTLNDDTIQNPIATPTQAITDYIVIVTDTLGGCFDTDTVEVRSCCIIPTITSDNSTCYDLDDGKIVVSATALNSNFTIEFHRNDIPFSLLQTYTGNSGDSIINLEPGSYIVLIFDSIGCSESDTLTITEPFPLTITPITALPDTFICIDGTATISALGGGATPPITLNWNNGLSGLLSHQVNPTANITNYTVYAEDANGCVSDTSKIDIYLYPPIVITGISLTENTICEGTTTTILVNASGGGTGLIYTWYDSNNNIVGATDTGAFIITPSFDGEMFSVIVSDSCTTPTKTDSIMTDWADIVLPDYTVTNTEGCYDDLSFNPIFENTTLNLGDMPTSTWDFGNGTTYVWPFAAPFNYHYDDPGVYDITLTVTDATGCEWDTIIADYQITAHDNPLADFSWNPNPTDYLNAEITFNNLTTIVPFYQWTFITDAQNTSTDVHPVFQFPQNRPGNYDVTLVATSKAGCVDSITKIVVIDDVFLFYIPTGFTPDGDGINDSFKVVGEGLDLSSFKMTVFNKWGQLVFESNNPDIGWDGTQNGDLVPDGVYIWKIDAKEAHSSIVHNKDGFITIVR